MPRRNLGQGENRSGESSKVRLVWFGLPSFIWAREAVFCHVAILKAAQRLKFKRIKYFPSSFQSITFGSDGGGDRLMKQIWLWDCSAWIVRSIQLLTTGIKERGRWLERGKRERSRLKFKHPNTKKRSKLWLYSRIRHNVEESDMKRHEMFNNVSYTV